MAKYSVVSDYNYEHFETRRAALEYALEEDGTVTVWERIAKIKNPKRKK